MTIHLTWHGPPKGQPRAKATRRGAFVRMYTPDTADEMKDGIRRLAMEAMARGEWDRYDGPVEVNISAYFQRPESHFRRVKGQPVLKSSSPLYHTQKPDADNVAKAVLDALGSTSTWGGIWYDDKQVASLIVTKMYAGRWVQPLVDVVVTRLPGINQEP